MNQPQDFLSIGQIARKFEKIYQGLDKIQLSALEKELTKVYPSAKSQVWIFPDYDEQENSVGMGIYVSNPLENVQKPKNFAEIMFDFLANADLQKLPILNKCLDLMERKTGDKYEIDFIPVFYNDELKNHYIQCRIHKIS